MLPEAELWTEVILQAIDDLDRRTSSASLLAQDSARQWFASDHKGIGTFVWSCRVVDVDPSRVRSAGSAGRSGRHQETSSQESSIIRRNGYVTFTTRYTRHGRSNGCFWLILAY